MLLQAASSVLALGFGLPQEFSETWEGIFVEPWSQNQTRLPPKILCGLVSKRSAEIPP